MNPNENYLTNPSTKLVKDLLIYVVNLFGEDRPMVEINSYFIFPTLIALDSETDDILNRVRESSTTFSNYSNNSLQFVLFNTLVASDYMTKRKGKYYLTSEGYKLGLKYFNDKFHSSKDNKPSRETRKGNTVNSNWQNSILTVTGINILVVVLGGILLHYIISFIIN
ncbi:hypothetical protein [Aliivibrio fischeri]|uniref:hypothetical protein n=1 Tax=Aliivibrio fischeri TaxID=668 RepID=UPI00037252BD|nr:hypothetical protein [Aliivibrio fischeri]OEE11626.1 hypothetical protein A1Q3_09490 [Aliivibrio fischeri ZF-211]